MPIRRPARAVVFAALLAVVAAACSGSDGDAGQATAGVDGDVVAAQAPAQPQAPAVREATPREVTAPPPPSPDPSAAPASASIPPTVEVQRPDLVVRPPADSRATALYAAFGVEGVSHLAGVAAFKARIPTGDGGEDEVSVMAVDPATFRPLTPEVTAQEPSVWERLAEGDVLVIHEVAHRLRLELGGTVSLDGPAAGREVRIGAFASNGAPPLADVIVPWDVGSALGAKGVNALVVALDEDQTGPTKASEAIVAALGGGRVEVRDEPVQHQARIVQRPGRATIEPFSYTDLGDGMIVIDPAWVQRWIVTVDLPGLGRTRCHRTMVPQLFAALEEIQQAGLYEHLRPEQFAGCHVPRHIDWNPSKPLSMHAWGLAIDFNSIDNALGRTPLMDRRIVAIFEKWGFEWGGWWSRPDGMHFELDRIIDMG
jgi:hypothetical protein